MAGAIRIAVRDVPEFRQACALSTFEGAIHLMVSAKEMAFASGRLHRYCRVVAALTSMPWRARHRGAKEAT